MAAVPVVWQGGRLAAVWMRVVDGCRDGGLGLGGQRRLCSKRRWKMLSYDFGRAGGEVAGSVGCDVLGVLAMYTTPS